MNRPRGQFFVPASRGGRGGPGSTMAIRQPLLESRPVRRALASEAAPVPEAELAHSAAEARSQSPALWVLKLCLWGYLGLSFVGILGIQPLSHFLRFSAWDLLAALGLGVALYLDPQGIQRIKAVVPYLVSVVVYFGLGAVLLDQVGEEDFVQKALTNFVFCITLTLTVAVAFAGRRDLVGFSCLVQAVMVLTVLVGALEIRESGLVGFLKTEGSHEYVDGEVLNRAGSFLRNPNELSMCCVFAMLLAYWAPFPIAFAGMAVSLYGVFLSASRSGVLAALLVVIPLAAARYAVIPKRLRQRARWMLALTGLLVCAGAGVVLLRMRSAGTLDLAELSLRVSRMFDYHSGFTAADRLQLAEFWAKRAVRALPFGEGLFVFIGDYSSGGTQLGAHNFWILLLGEVGVIGVLAYLGAVVTGLVRLARANLSASDRWVLWLFWVVWFFGTMKMHTFLHNRHSSIVMALMLLLPLLLAGSGTSRPASDREARSGEPSGPSVDSGRRAVASSS